MKAERFGLIGRKLGHSYSKTIHQKIADYSYDLIEIEKEQLEDLLKNGDYKGFNITIPYKEEAYKYCHHLSEQALKLANVNTILKDGPYLRGYNTDYGGFKQLLEKNKIEPKGKKIAILGQGGSAKTSYQVCKDMEADSLIYISRKGENKFQDLEKYRDCQILINATPVGMYPNNMESLVDLDNFRQLEAVVDLIYNPAWTKLLLDARAKSIKAVNGLDMLVYQAKLAAEIFTQTSISMGKYEEIYMEVRNQNINIALIGMAGVGKTSYSQRLAQELGRQVLSLDSLIEERAGLSCQDLILSRGEEVFRQFETAILKEVSKDRGKIIDCGGGIVVREENYNYLKQNSIIYWLRRDINDLPTANRPLSQANNLEELYKKRQPTYRKWADRIIDL